VDTKHHGLWSCRWKPPAGPASFYATEWQGRHRHPTLICLDSVLARESSLPPNCPPGTIWVFLMNQVVQQHHLPASCKSSCLPAAACPGCGYTAPPDAPDQANEAGSIWTSIGTDRHCVEVRAWKKVLQGRQDPRVSTASALVLVLMSSPSWTGRGAPPSTPLSTDCVIVLA
jgi:hypothetical protein